MGSIKNRILIYFCTSVAVIILIILLAVNITLRGGIENQFQDLVQEATSREKERLSTYENFLNKHLSLVGKDMLSAALEIAGNTDLSENIDFVQLNVLSSYELQLKTNILLEEIAFSSRLENDEEQSSKMSSYAVVESGKFDFAVIVSLKNEILTAYPNNENAQVLADFCKAMDLAASARENTAQIHARNLSKEFLSAVGLTNQGKSYERETAALISANLIKDEFDNTRAFLLTGKLYDHLEYALASFNEATGAPAAIFLGNQAASQAGFKVRDGRDIYEALKLEGNASQKLLTEGVNAPVIASLAGNDYLVKTIPLETNQGTVLGFALAGLPMNQVHAMENNLDQHGQNMLKKVAKWISGVGVLAMGAFILLSLFISEGITRPIRRIALMVRDMSEGDGDLTVRLKEEGRDELTDLAKWFNVFMGKLQAMVIEIKEGSELLAVSSSQISSTASELASSSAQTSSSISEISTTMEEVKQTAALTSEKAEIVADTAESAAQHSESGEKATHDALMGMNHVKEEMEFIAESIVKLSEQTQSIGDIIDAVGDLANESNLLSVNASIEAAKAGEYGKGFSVVAQEVKNLADQSKQATGQVRTILNDIQSATSTAVMATERGSKAVDSGVGLSSQSGQTIQDLVESVNQAARAAAQIAASNRQQMAGMDQLSQAMTSIKDASLQNVDGAKQLEGAISDMHELGQRMKELAGKFKV
ncbi:methyl-accepting chemotaxis protein [Desulfatibacillum aliphaticivorans]|uniref:Protein with methyl-accepting chemotaxis protein (MCP) signaling domain n=1 Tax=Desulfatibacillum aliphaticivorans TaxID=218208 RepID=B8FNR4_DESAL|nr:methyl-accepting chemotaxis protein [Desulfatibacillum aliphaticivorans]ACL06345.1 Protein with methyl-accepting chemotaxis protein (MCP) signaling domain [Desulfatibacillum aliphaticivorans]